MRIGWISGWAVPEDWFSAYAHAAFPECEHLVLQPSPRALADLRAGGPFDWIAGYSLGSHLLLGDMTSDPICERMALLAPIWAFPSESGMGGKVSRTQVRQLARWIRRDTAAALGDFYQRAGLDVPIDPSPSHDIETLLWGLGQLEGDGVPARLPAGARAWCGSHDALLDARRIQDLVPEVRNVGNATHHPADLMRAFAEEIS